MAVDTTWTDPSTGGAIDLNTGGIVTETIYDKILSNLKRLGGTSGDAKTGDYNISTITLSGGQIAFPAAQSASAGVNTLDDYEEGTWTVAVTCGTSGTVTLDASYDTGLYTKIGDIVHVQGLLKGSSVSSPMGDLRISLPFTVIDGPEESGHSGGSVSLSDINLTVGCVGVACIAPTPLAYLIIVQTIDSGGWDNLQASEMAGANDLIVFECTYKVAT